MAKGFFRELKHYTVYEIAKNLETTIEEAKYLAGILKRYGIIKAVKASKPEYENLSNQDVVLTDISESNTDIEYVFDFVGIVMLEEHLFKCYPKYILSTSEPMQQLKKVLKVIRKYNDKEQLVYLYSGEEDNVTFNRLAVSLYLLEDYFLHGMYTNQHEVIETNGDGEILWDRTINETFALLQNNRPYYIELQTRNVIDNEMDYFRRLHGCVLSQCTAELKDSGILELFDIAEAELTNARIEDFGDTDYIKYRLEREIQAQFVTRKQTLLKTIYTYISNEKAEKSDVNFNLYGTNSFEDIWEKVCAENFDSVLHEKLEKLPPGVCDEYTDRRHEELINIIDRPVWYKNNPVISGGKVKTLKPDLICIYPYGDDNQYCFGIYDAKYYCINFEEKKSGYKVTGQPGVEDITKQYLYQLAYEDFIEKQGYQYVQNTFLCPQEEACPDYGYVEMKMLHSIGNKTLENIAVSKLCAEEMYDLYLADKKVDNITDYIPNATCRPAYNQSFVNRMSDYLRRISKVNQEMGLKQRKLIYPEQIKREPGAKLIYDMICMAASEVFYEFSPYGQEPDTLVAENVGNSYWKYEQIADASLKIETAIKDLKEENLQNERSIASVLAKCFEGMNELQTMMQETVFSGNLIKRIMELIKNTYL